ncbi:MAG TPA: flagellar motor switch protein FliG [Candidatus Angelobacter sp.]|nr:flagellar motor switch protein FliG [Candidatus Angelobacter sp.]
MKQGIESISGIQKAAVLMIMLGDEAASMLYRNLPDHDVQEITHAIAVMEEVSPQLGSEVLQEYYRMSLTQEYVTQGGEDFARKLLVKAFGEATARDLLLQVEKSKEARASDLDSLRRADPQQLAKFLEGEHPQTIALITAHLEVRHAAELIGLLSEKVRADVVRRLAEMNQFSTDMAQKVSLMLNKKLQSVVKARQRGYSGLKSVADIMNRMPQDTVKEILENVEASDANVALSIRNLMFTFEDFLSTPEASIREIVAQLDKKVLGTALKNASDEVKSHFFKCMSSRAAEMLREDMEVMGPVRTREIQQAQQEAVNLARSLESQGKIILKAAGDDEFVV